jgi:hypothetical protein
MSMAALEEAITDLVPEKHCLDECGADLFMRRPEAIQLLNGGPTRSLMSRAPKWSCAVVISNV